MRPVGRAGAARRARARRAGAQLAWRARAAAGRGARRRRPAPRSARRSAASGCSTRPVELGHELAQRRGSRSSERRALCTSSSSSAWADSSEKFSPWRRRPMSGPPGTWRKRKRARGAHPEVEVLGQAEAGVVAADGLVDAAVDHARWVDERVVLARPGGAAARAAGDPGCGHAPRWTPSPSMIDARRRGPRRCRDGDRRPRPGGRCGRARPRRRRRAWPRARRAPRGRSCCTPRRSRGWSRGARCAGAGRRSRQDLLDVRVGAAVQHDEDLEVVVGLAQAGGDCLGKVRVALVRRDTKGDSGGHGSPLASADGCGGFRAPSPTLGRRARGRLRPRLGHRQAGDVRHQRRRRPRAARSLPVDGRRERPHPDPVGGDDALRRLQRPPGRVPAVGARRGRFGGEPRRVVDVFHWPTFSNGGRPTCKSWAGVGGSDRTGHRGRGRHRRRTDRDRRRAERGQAKGKVLESRRPVERGDESGLHAGASGPGACSPVGVVPALHLLGIAQAQADHRAQVGEHGQAAGRRRVAAARGAAGRTNQNGGCCRRRGRRPRRPDQQQFDLRRVAGRHEPAMPAS